MVVLGSPPRVRGKVSGMDVYRPKDGITPACAGKSLLPWVATDPERDHPRVCGEKFRDENVDNAAVGSPPRVRGKVACKDGSAITFRITPACAGKSPETFSRRFPSRDHPRVCGEKKKMNMRKDRRMGSPPRVRGKERQPVQCK